MESKPDWASLEKKTHCKTIFSFSSLDHDGNIILIPVFANPKVDRVELLALYEQFRSLSTVEKVNGGITKETFDHCLGPMGSNRNLIVERIFAFFDQNEDGMISFEELTMGVSVLCKGSLDERIKCEHTSSSLIFFNAC